MICCVIIFMYPAVAHLASSVATLGSQFRFHGNEEERGIPNAFGTPNWIRGCTLVLSQFYSSACVIDAKAGTS